MYLRLTIDDLQLKNVNEKTLENICAELAPRLTGQKFGKIFALSRFRLAIDFRLHDSSYLYISVEPSAPRIYLITRRLRDLEKQSKNSSPFIIFLRSKLANAILQTIEKLENERILRFNFAARDELGQLESYTLVVQLTGRSANLFLLDKADFILDAMRENSGTGQQVNEKYAAPLRDGEFIRKTEEGFAPSEFDSLSAALDAHYLEIEAEKAFQAKVGAARNKLNQETKKTRKAAEKSQ